MIDRYAMGSYGMAPSKDGDFVRYSDHQHALAEKDLEIEKCRMSAAARDAQRAIEYQQKDQEKEQWRHIAEDWAKAADLSQQPDDFYQGYSEKQMRAMQALLTRKTQAYQQLMEQAVGLAETVLQGHRHRLKTLRIIRANASITLADKLLNSPEAQAFLKEREGASTIS